jgi:hypothetical protein
MYGELMNLTITAHRSGYKIEDEPCPEPRCVTQNAGRFATFTNDHSLGRELNTMRADSRRNSHREKIIVAIMTQRGGIMIAQNDNKNILKAALPSNRAKALGRFFRHAPFCFGQS